MCMCTYWNKVSLRKSSTKNKKRIDSIGIGLASPEEIRSWGERELPNGTLVGKVDRDHTVDYESLKPIEGGLFCERIFGPVEDFYCSCERRGEKNEKFCPDCEVEFTKSRVRRTRMGYIPLAVPVAHVWYLRGRPSYIANFIGKSRNTVDKLAYGETLCESFVGNTSINYFKHGLEDLIKSEKRRFFIFNMLKSNRESNVKYVECQNQALDPERVRGYLKSKKSVHPLKKLSKKIQKTPRAGVTPVTVQNSVPKGSLLSNVSDSFFKASVLYQFLITSSVVSAYGRSQMQSLLICSPRKLLIKVNHQLKEIENFDIWKHYYSKHFTLLKNREKDTVLVSSFETLAQLLRIGNPFDLTPFQLSVTGVYGKRTKFHKRRNISLENLKTFLPYGTNVKESGKISSPLCRDISHSKKISQKSSLNSSMDGVHSPFLKYFAPVSEKALLTNLKNNIYGELQQNTSHYQVSFANSPSEALHFPSKIPTFRYLAKPKEDLKKEPFTKEFSPVSRNVKTDNFLRLLKSKSIKKKSGGLQSSLNGDKFSLKKRTYNKKSIFSVLKDSLLKIEDSKNMTSRAETLVYAEKALQSSSKSYADSQSKVSMKSSLHANKNMLQRKYNKFHTLPVFSTYIYKEWSHRFSFLEYFIWSPRKNDLALPFYTDQMHSHMARIHSMNLIRNQIGLERIPKEFTFYSNGYTKKSISTNALHPVQLKGLTPSDHLKKDIINPTNPLVAKSSTLFTLDKKVSETSKEYVKANALHFNDILIDHTADTFVIPLSPSLRSTRSPRVLNVKSPLQPLGVAKEISHSKEKISHSNDLMLPEVTKERRGNLMLPEVVKSSLILQNPNSKKSLYVTVGNKEISHLHRYTSSKSESKSKEVAKKKSKEKGEVSQKMPTILSTSLSRPSLDKRGIRQYVVGNSVKGYYKNENVHFLELRDKSVSLSSFTSLCDVKKSMKFYQKPESLGNSVVTELTFLSFLSPSKSTISDRSFVTENNIKSFESEISVKSPISNDFKGDLMLLKPRTGLEEVTKKRYATPWGSKEKLHSTNLLSIQSGEKGKTPKTVSFINPDRVRGYDEQEIAFSLESNNLTRSHFSNFPFSRKRKHDSIAASGNIQFSKVPLLKKSFFVFRQIEKSFGWNFSNNNSDKIANSIDFFRVDTSLLPSKSTISDRSLPSSLRSFVTYSNPVRGFNNIKSFISQNQGQTQTLKETLRYFTTFYNPTWGFNNIKSPLNLKSFESEISLREAKSLLNLDFVKSKKISHSNDFKRFREIKGDLMLLNLQTSGLKRTGLEEVTKKRIEISNSKEKISHSHKSKRFLISRKSNISFLSPSKSTISDRFFITESNCTPDGYKTQSGFNREGDENQSNANFFVPSIFSTFSVPTVRLFRSQMMHKKVKASDSSVGQSEKPKQVLHSNTLVSVMETLRYSKEAEGEDKRQIHRWQESLSSLKKVDETQQFPRLAELLHFTGGTVLRHLLGRFHLVFLGKYLRHELKNLEVKVNSLLALKMLTYSQGLLLGKLAKRRSKQIRRLKLLELFQCKKSNPEWMILSVIPVLPPDLRPILRVNDDFVVASDLNRLYQTVLRRNNTIHERLDDPLPCPESGLFRQRSLQKAVDGLLENGKGGGTPLCASKRRPLVSLSHVLKGKKGLFRQHLLGKRVDYSGRSVIVVGPRLHLHECGLPKEMALELFQPFLIHRLKVKGFATSNTTARRMIQREDPVIWHTVKQLVYEHPVLLNRAPTLHRLGIQAFQPRLVSGRAILLHPLVCNGFNADFDGDQMAVHVPLSFQARAEAWKIMWSKNNLLSPATGQPILVPSQDMVLGCYYLSVFLPRVLQYPSASFDKSDKVAQLVQHKMSTGLSLGFSRYSQSFLLSHVFESFLKPSILQESLMNSGAGDTNNTYTRFSLRSFVTSSNPVLLKPSVLKSSLEPQGVADSHSNDLMLLNVNVKSLISKKISKKISQEVTKERREDFTNPTRVFNNNLKQISQLHPAPTFHWNDLLKKNDQLNTYHLQRGHYFSHLQDSIMAFSQGRLETHTPFWVRLDNVLESEMIPSPVVSLTPPFWSCEESKEKAMSPCITSLAQDKETSTRYSLRSFVTSGNIKSFECEISLEPQEVVYREAKSLLKSSLKSQISHSHSNKSSMGLYGDFLIISDEKTPRSSNISSNPVLLKPPVLKSSFELQGVANSVKSSLILFIEDDKNPNSKTFNNIKSPISKQDRSEILTVRYLEGDKQVTNVKKHFYFARQEQCQNRVQRSTLTSPVGKTIVTPLKPSLLQPRYGCSEKLVKAFFKEDHQRRFIEANDKLEAPLELRLGADGYLVKISTAFQNHYSYNATALDQCKEKSVRYMRTTAGRVVINDMLFHF